uniref:Astacin domain-containing protein n=1 Tax=Strongyloides venezuelensis TaxID=75913 RepID=A0A0K0F198_STRVS
MMKQLFFTLFLVSLYLIQSTIEAKLLKFKRKSSKGKQLPAYVQCSAPIRYYFQIGLNDKYLITKAMYNIQCETFLKFKEEKNLINDTGINFFVNSEEDKVKLSYVDKTPTIVNLTENTYHNKVLAGFYFGYALGLIPEIARKDRNRKVKVFKQNILPKYRKFYKKKKAYPKSYYATRFDFSSIMFAKPFFGSKSRDKRTYKLKTYSDYNKQIKEFNEFSFNDYKRLNILYCKDECKNSIRCENFGYHGDNCDSCKCFFPFRGRDCRSYVLRSKECGKEFATKAYPKPRQKIFTDLHGECYYIIKANNPKKKVKLTIKKFNTTKIYSYDLIIKYRKDKGAEGLKIERNITELKFPPLSRSVIITYTSYDWDNELVLEYQEVKRFRKIKSH